MDTQEGRVEGSGGEKVGKYSLKNPDFRNVLVIGAVVLLIVFGVAWKKGYLERFLGPNGVSKEQVGEKVNKFISNDIKQEGVKVETKSIVEENGLYKVTLSIQDQENVFYASKNGKMIFKGANMDEAAEAAKKAEAPKQALPQVELFVMSYCPFGTQIEKGILPVIEKLGKKIDFKLRFVDYIMHEKVESDENLKQYCIQKNEPEKLSSYLGCFLKDDKKAKQCLSTAGINSSKLSSCIAEADKQFKVSANFADKTTWKGQYPTFNVDADLNAKYGVKGSPTLVLNGTIVESGRDSSSLLEAICNGFESKPAECGEQLPSAVPSPGFGDGSQAAGNASPASCGS